MTSKEIYQDILIGDSSKAYYYLHKKYIRLIITRFTKNNCNVESEERFSYAFVKLYDKIKSKEINHENLGGYFTTICRNNFLIGCSRNKVLYKDVLPEYINSNYQEDLELQSLNETASNLIDLLPKTLKSVCTKIYLEDKNHKEVSKELSMNYNNVRKYHHKAIKRLKQHVPSYLRELIID